MTRAAVRLVGQEAEVLHRKCLGRTLNPRVSEHTVAYANECHIVVIVL